MTWRRRLIKAQTSQQSPGQKQVFEQSTHTLVYESRVGERDRGYPGPIADAVKHVLHRTISDGGDGRIESRRRLPMRWPLVVWPWTSKQQASDKLNRLPTFKRTMRGQRPKTGQLCDDEGCPVLRQLEVQVYLRRPERIFNLSKYSASPRYS